MKTLTDSILEEIEPTIEKLLIDYEKQFKKDFEREMSEFDKEMTRLTLIYDMLRSVEVYTLSTDTLISINTHTTPKGSLEIVARIQRDGVTYPFRTEVIYAGGYNIQRLHFRYLTHTTLPMTNKSSETNRIKEKITRLSKVQKINNEIESLKKRIVRNSEIAEVNRKLSDEEILDADEHWQHFRDVDWNTIVERGVDKNFEGGKEEFDKRKADQRQRTIDGFKYRKIKTYEENSKSLQKEIEKLQGKLKLLEPKDTFSRFAG